MEDKECLYMNLESWLALFALVFTISDWVLVSLSKIAVQSKIHRIGFIVPLLLSPVVSSLLLVYRPIKEEFKTVLNPFETFKGRALRVFPGSGI